MKRIACTGTLLAFAVAGYSGAALAQQDCQADIEQLRSQLQERQTDQQRRQRVSRMLDQAEQAGPGQCQRFVTQARQQLQAGTGSAAGQTTVTRAPGYEQGQQPEQQQQSAQQQQAQQRQQQQQAQQAQQQRVQDSTQAARSQQQGAGQQAQDAERMDVQVEQAPAQVQVEQGVPRVIVRQQPPKVTVEQQPPIVEIVQPEAQVHVTQADPQVRINQTEPEIQVEGAEAEVEVIEAGEPIVRMVGQEGAGAERQAAPAAQAGTATSRQATETINEREAQQLVGRDALARDGEDVGSVSEVVRARSDNSLHAVVDVGGFFGIGQRPVAIPLQRGRIDQEGNLHLEMTSDQLEQLQEYDEQRYVPAQ